MRISELVEGLSCPEAYPHPVDGVEVIQTHISVVFLAGEFVYKVKKPVDLGFLDFTTLALREHFCLEEVRLNRRLAPDVYLGVVGIVEEGGGVRVDLDRPPRAGRPAPGESPLEWAVRMRRLPEDLTMAAWLEEGNLRPYHVAVIGRRVAEFHAIADRGPEISAWGSFDVVAGNARENLDQSLPHIGTALTPELHARLSAALERELVRLEPAIEARAEAGVPRDTHGDLHLDHVYIFPDRDPPENLVIIDCIEFNERFRFADPVADVAFLDMDLRYHGAHPLATVLTEAYFEAASGGDGVGRADEGGEGRTLLPFYSAYRAAVRAKVAGMRASEPEVPRSTREAAIESACAHWLLALGLLEPPTRRPCLVLVGGLPGTGKSTLARSLAERGGFAVLSSDVTRKRLAGIDPEASAATAFGAGIYTSAWNDRTYEALLKGAREALLRGERVIVDASFREDARRRAFLSLAADLKVSGIFLELEAPPNRVRNRIASRTSGPSDADEDVYEAAAARWEPGSELSDARTDRVDTGQSPAWSVEQSVAHLREAGVL